ncbi:hypothetical protein BC332_23048 [Capsicum chinense]|nr:hypothetical protein BC332_23048 [Capsicum chinense]
MAVNWDELPKDLIDLIAKRVKVKEDFIAFGVVCTSLRNPAINANFDFLSPQLPLLILADRYDYYREFYSLSRKKVSRYLVELSGPLLNISRFYEAEGGDTYEVFEIDVSKVGLKEIHTLGDYAVFLGLNGAICIDFSKFTEVKSNHIYFVNGDGRDLRAYNIEDGKVESCYHGESRSYLWPPTWVIPSL